jgi:hypothetical protein
VPPEKNQGSLSDQPVEPGATPQSGQNTPNANPITGGPAAVPAPTSTPKGTPVATGVGKPITPASEQQSGANQQGGGKRKKLGLIGTGLGVVVIVVAGLLLLPFSPFSLVRGVPKGPKMMVGQNDYVYACSVFDADTVGKEMGLSLDKSKQNVEESLSFDPSNTKDKTVDLIKLTGRTSVDSNCKLKFDRVLDTSEEGEQTASFINVSAFIQQFPGESEATNKFNDSKKLMGSQAKTLASFTSNSYYVTPTKPKSGPTYVQPIIKYKNMLIYLTAPLKSDDQDAKEMAGQLDKVAKDVTKRIEEKQGAKPKNFSGVTKLGQKKFVDACGSINFQRYAKVVGGDIQFEPTSFMATQNYATNNDGGKSPDHLISLCNFSFRTKSEADAIASQRPEVTTDQSSSAEDPYASRYPHIGLVQIITTAKKEDAQKLVTTFRDNVKKNPVEGQPKIQDVKLGDIAIKAESKHNETTPYDTTLYYIAKGPHAYFFSISYKRQSQPFKTTDQTFADDQARQLLSVFSTASSYSQRQ